MNSPLEGEVKQRFGIVPNFFRLASVDPTISQNLWGFAEFAYLDNPMPPLFKERLFVYLSRFCEIRYCIARHVGFLLGLGRPAGDADTLPQTIEGVLPLLRFPLPHGEAFTKLLEATAGLEGSGTAFPAPDSAAERCLFACATHVFLQTPDAARAHEALRSALPAPDLEHLNVFLTFVRMAHYWTRIHPGLRLEDDISQLLAAHEALAECVLGEADANTDLLSRQLAMELASLQALRDQNSSMQQAYETLAIDHQFVKQSLEDRETNLRELVSAMPAAVYACDTEGLMFYYNRQAVALWGREPELSEKPWAFLNARRIYLADGVLLGAKDAPVRAVLTTGIPIVNRELVLERPDGSRIDVLLNVAPLRDSSGRISGAVNIFQDISGIKRAQRERDRLLEELERSNRELSQFSYSVSHDLQAPVRSVRALTKLLVRRSEGTPEDAAQLADLIEQASGGMERLIESLLTYAQVGQGELSRQDVSTEAVIDGVRVSLAEMIEKTGARIVHGKLPTVDADPVQIEQLFQNLIANAIKYQRPGEPPIIEILAEPFEDGWRFAVRDNGEGIAEEYHSQIFEPLKRLHGADLPGTGLGLALCRTIAGRHGGRIWVESKGAGQGATFRFTISGAGRKPLAVSEGEAVRT